VRIVERTPIAIVYSGGAFYYFDPAGVRIGKATATDKLPVLDIKGSPAKSETFSAAIDVLLALPAKMLPRIALVTAKSTDNVTFRLRGYAGQRVIWGDKSNAALKSKVLAALIANQSANDRVTYDVSSPSAPTVRY
jgi:cell division protein FtsQ